MKKKMSKDMEVDEDVDDAPAESSNGRAMFNKAIPFLTHIQALELICSEASINGDFKKWFDALQSWCNKLTGKSLRDDVKKKKIETIDTLFARAEMYIENSSVNEIYKRKMLNNIQRELEVLTDEFGYQMPEVGGDDDEPLNFD